MGALALAPMAVTACLNAPDESLARVRQRGHLTAGYAVEAPYADLRDDGRVDGESPSVARRVSERLGLAEVEWVQVEFSHLIDDLVATRYDLVAAGLFITEERRRRVHFSRPTLRVREGWLARPGHPAAMLSYAAARQRAGWRLVALHGSLEERLLGGAQAQVIAAPDVRTALALVSTGAADALALSLPAVRHLASRDPSRLAATAAPSHPESGTPTDRFIALAMRPQDHSLHGAVDLALQAYLGSPLHLQDLQRLGLGADDLPPAGTS